MVPDAGDRFYFEWAQSEAEEPAGHATLRQYKRLFAKKAANEQTAISATLMEYAQNVRNSLSDYQDEYKLEKISHTYDFPVIDLLVQAARFQPKGVVRPPTMPTGSGLNLIQIAGS